jgi:dedicator of cytokinesis protein 1
LTKSQVASLRQFTASFNFTTSPSLNSKSNLNSNTKSLMMPQTKSLTTTPALNHKKSFKITKEKRRSAKSDCTPSPSVISGATQWYTTEDITNGTPIFELTEELTPKRPLRSEVEKEKRLSRPSSGQFSRSSSLSITLRGTGSSGSSSNRDSVGTTDSSVSEEDSVPPPLPIKLREVDYYNLPNNENASFLYSQRNSLRNSMPVKNPAADPINFDDVPPIPPPKPPKNKNITNS